VAFIETIPEEEATGPVAEAYADDRAGWGFLPNFSKVFALRPEVYAAWSQLNGSVRKVMDRRRYELATVAAAHQLRSSYCTMAHSRVLRDRFYDAQTVREIVVDRRAAGLDEVDVAVMDFAEQVAADATAITADDVDKLRRLGLSDVEVLDIALAVGVRSFFAKVLDAVGALPDAQFREILEPELQEALTIGRPIAET
jgi:uncharacterized peroxidase-related enzyme